MGVFAALLALAGGCGSGQESADAAPTGGEVCAAEPGTSVSFDADGVLCDKLSSYRFFVAGGDGSALSLLQPNDGVVPYTVRTPLFSDYTDKDRFVWLPEGTAMHYRDSDSFELPVGAVLIKTFSYRHDLRDDSAGRRLLETRLLSRTGAGWDVITYLWNDEQTEAIRHVAGAAIDAQWVDASGQTRQNRYLVPNKNQCKNCHEEHDDTIAPIGIKARHLNDDLDYPSGTANQLAHLAEIGYLTGLPADPATWPRAPVWNDEATGSLDERARAWLDINCAHCHNPRGAARTSGLDLSPAQQSPYEYGVCKAPIAAGAGSGGRIYNIVPGQPDASITMFRLESTAPDVRMPEVGRRLIDDEGTALIRAWITAMEGECGP